MHGSYLYGLAHSQSDIDLYRVILTEDKHYNSHKVYGGQWDFTVLSLDRFVDQVNKGVPQALEALYAQHAYHHSDYWHYLRGLRPDRYTVAATYWRTALNFAEGDYKSKRHALRLALNLFDFMRDGFFDPRLSDAEITLVNTYARFDTKEFRVFIRSYLEYSLRGVL